MDRWASRGFRETSVPWSRYSFRDDNSYPQYILDVHSFILLKPDPRARPIPHLRSRARYPGLLKSALIARARTACVAARTRSAREPLAARFYDRAYPVARGRYAVVRTVNSPRWRSPCHAGDAAGLWLRLSSERLSDDMPRDYVVCLHGTARPSFVLSAVHLDLRILCQGAELYQSCPAGPDVIDCKQALSLLRL